MKGSRFCRFEKKMVVAAAAGRSSSSSSSVTLGRRAPLRCCPGTSFLREMVCKLKGRWNKALGWQRRRSPQPQYSYDLHSYCLNFDDGAFSEGNYY